MRIAHVVTKGDVGGAQTHVAELAAAQIFAGHDVVVIAGTDGPAMERCRASGVRVSIVESLGAARRSVHQWRAVVDTRRVLNDVAPDVVHAHSSNAGLVARAACKLQGVVCVYTAHGWPFQRGAAPVQRIISLGVELIGGRLGDGVICLTEAEATTARRARVVRRDRLWVIANGVSDVPPALRARHGSGPPHIVVVARFAPPKQHRELVQVMSSLMSMDWTLTFVGEGPDLPQVRREAAASLRGRATFLGARDDVAQILGKHEVMVLWSAYEGMPMSLLEGMRAGLCCVASDLPGVRALFGTPAAGVTADSSDQLAVALVGVIGSSELRAELGNRARARYEQAFSAVAMERAVVAVYRNLIARSASSWSVRESPDSAKYLREDR